jgi:hypothetical protein
MSGKPSVGQYTERVIIQRVEYADGSFWVPPVG